MKYFSAYFISRWIRIYRFTIKLLFRYKSYFIRIAYFVEVFSAIVKVVYCIN
ncbi:hypothetical protein PPV_Vac110-(019-020)n1 [Avipoxvirus sp.]|uniref:Uncharacterized protein n=1 Tax=Fowlpox virus TaxID=10261 RepID=A0A891M0S1_FOWPV|nr:hypothetical protein [Fowlpox virus]UNS14203.1 ALPV-039 [Albatrosspox virus]WPD90971.1 hypothetical protein PPV_Vac110-(019-020)n1 [Avipoxvirus sp.]